MRFSVMNPGITCTPWLFWDMTQDLDDSTFLALAEAGGWIVLASVLLDHLADGQAGESGATALLGRSLRHAGLRRFRQAIPATSTFWAHLRRLDQDHIMALSLEAQARARPATFSQRDFIRMARGKFAPIAVAMAAILTTLGREERLGPVERSIRDLAVASQLLDDLGDWQEDLAAGRLTYFLSRLAPPACWAERPWPSPAEIQQAIDASWQDLEHLDLVESWLQGSLQAVEGLVCPAWKAYLVGYRSLARQHAARLAARHLMRAIEPLLTPGPH